MVVEFGEGFEYGDIVLQIPLTVCNMLFYANDEVRNQMGRDESMVPKHESIDSPLTEW